MASSAKDSEPTDDGEFFPYERDGRYGPLFKVLGLKETDGVTVTSDGRLIATYGRTRLETPLSNVSHTEVTGPHRWYTAVGIRLSFTDDGITFGTNYRSGLCIAFVEKIPKVVGFRSHSALWVSVADPHALAARLTKPA